MAWCKSCNLITVNAAERKLSVILTLFWFENLSLNKFCLARKMHLKCTKETSVVTLWALPQSGEGHYYENQNIENQKEHRKICKPSLHQNVYHYIKNQCLFSSSLLQKSDHRKECEKNIESISFVWFYILTSYFE